MYHIFCLPINNYMNLKLYKMTISNIDAKSRAESVNVPFLTYSVSCT